MKEHDIIVIPDSHSTPKHDNDRMYWLGQYIMEVQPGYVHHLGDMHDMRCFSSYDEGTMSAWQQHYREDVRSGVHHQVMLWLPRHVHNERRRQQHKSLYLPTTSVNVGNHEDRADRFINRTPSMCGWVDVIADTRMPEFWDQVIPYKHEHRIQGVSFCHYFGRQGSGRPISGVATGRALAQNLHRSAIQGHNHYKNFYDMDRGPDYPKIFCGTAGYYGHPECRELWCLQQQDGWEYGVLHLKNVQNGWPVDGYEWVSMSRLEREYGHLLTDDVRREAAAMTSCLLRRDR